MTVSELIEKLRTMPQDAKVTITIQDNTGLSRWDPEVRDVIKNDDNWIELDNWPAEGYHMG